MFGCDDISDHASWNEVFHYWDTKLSCKKKSKKKNKKVYETGQDQPAKAYVMIS